MPTALCHRAEPRNRGMAKREKKPMGKVAEMRVIVGDKKETDRAEGLRILEALLFAAEGPLDEKVLASRLPTGIDVHALLQQLQREYAPRGAYSRCNCWSKACTSIPVGSREARTFSSSGPSAANNKASRMRSPSARSVSFLSPTITRISATFPIGFFSLLAIPRFRGSAL